MEEGELEGSREREEEGAGDEEVPTGFFSWSGNVAIRETREVTEGLERGGR